MCGFVESAQRRWFARPVSAEDLVWFGMVPTAKAWFN